MSNIEHDVKEVEEERIVNREVKKIKYIGVSNVTTNNNVLILTGLKLYDGNTLINANYLTSNNTGNTSSFINYKNFIELFDQGYLLLQLDNEVSVDNLKIELKLGNSFEIQNMVLFMGDDLNNYSYYKFLNNETNNFSEHYISSFTLDNTYKEKYYKYYEKKYMCYKIERDYADDYYENLDGYIKDEEDYIVLDKDKATPDERVPDDEVPYNVVRELSSLTKVNNHTINTSYNYNYANNKKEESKKTSEQKNNNAKSKKIKKQIKKENNINHLFLIILLFLFSLIASIIYFVKKSRTK